MDLGKDENTLTIAERDEVERQILEAIDSYVKEVAKTGEHTSGLMDCRMVADNTPYFAHAAYRKISIMDWLEILKEKRMIEQGGKSMPDAFMVRLTGRGLERTRTSEKDYRARSKPIANQLSNVFNAPVAQFAQTTGDNAAIHQSQPIIDGSIILPLVERLLLEVSNHSNIPTDATAEAEQLMIEVKKERPSMARIVDSLETIKRLAVAALPVVQVVEEIRKLIP